MSDIPAFPVHPEVRDDEPHAGMSLRDYFAAMALNGIGTWSPIPYAGHPGVSLDSDQGSQLRSEWAYRQADAMLRARGA